MFTFFLLFSGLTNQQQCLGPKVICVQAHAQMLQLVPVTTWTPLLNLNQTHICTQSASLYCVSVLQTHRLPQSAEWLPALWGQGAGCDPLERSPSAAVTGPEPGGLCHPLLTVSGLQVSSFNRFKYSNSTDCEREEALNKPAIRKQSSLLVVS